MLHSFITSTLLSIAAANPAGFTVNASNLQPVRTGFAVALAATQDSHGLEGLSRVINYATKHPGTVDAFGGWMDSEDGQYYWDAVIIVRTRRQAERLARENGQIAFFHLTTGTEIRCK